MDEFINISKIKQTLLLQPQRSCLNVLRLRSKLESDKRICTNIYPKTDNLSKEQAMIKIFGTYIFCESFICYLSYY